MVTITEIQSDFPVHWYVWNNDFQELKTFIAANPNFDLEKRDPRGRTALMLAICLCHLQSVKVLLAAKCDANVDIDGWTAVQEAVSTGDANIITAILEVRDLQRHSKRVAHVPQLLQRLLDAPDFYVEMKWEFTSWVPLMSTICPSDVYKVYKRGSNVRIDTTLLGFDTRTWKRGNRSYIFKGSNDSATMIEVDHDAAEVSIEQMRSVMSDIAGIPPTREAVNARLNAPVTSNHIDIEKISFERNKSGIWGWRSEKSEDVNGYDCKVYAASNVEFITRTRTEHLNEAQSRTKNSRTPLQSFFGIAEEELGKSSEAAASAVPPPALAIKDKTPSPSTSEGGNSGESDSSSSDKEPVRPEDYFSTVDLQGRDIGRSKKIQSKVQKFKANLWLSEDFPIQLQEQVLPILDLMSTMASPHVSKLKDFITMQLPSGFPVKIEIPLFHVLNACVTFCNVFAMTNEVEHVSHIQEDNRVTCVIDDRCFDVPSHYTRRGSIYRRQMTFDDEDDLVQFAIQQSLLETGSENDEVDIWEALKVQRPITPNVFSEEDTQLQRALHESLLSGSRFLPSSLPPMPAEAAIAGFDSVEDDEIDAELEMALKLSEEEQKNLESEIEKEQKLLEEILKLSLDEK